MLALSQANGAGDTPGQVCQSPPAVTCLSAWVPRSYPLLTMQEDCSLKLAPFSSQGKKKCSCVRWGTLTDLLRRSFPSTREIESLCGTPEANARLVNYISI